LAEHEIKLTDEIPFKQPFRRIPPSLYEEVREHLASRTVLLLRVLKSMHIRKLPSDLRTSTTLEEKGLSNNSFKCSRTSSYNITAKSVVIKPKSVFCELKEVKVIRDGFEFDDQARPVKLSTTKDRSLKDLGIRILMKG
jgi:hypothetical protein